MVIRPVKGEDAHTLFDMMCLLDGETPFMMYEPGERRKKAEINGFRNRRLYLGGERETEPRFAHSVSCCGHPGGVPEPGNRRHVFSKA